MANSQSVTTNQGVAKAITLASTDPNGDPLIFQVTSGPFSGTLTGSGATLTYTPLAGFSGSDNFVFTVTDVTTGLVSNGAHSFYHRDRRRWQPTASQWHH